jgi:hypothetical protein
LSLSAWTKIGRVDLFATIDTPTVWHISRGLEWFPQVESVKHDILEEESFLHGSTTFRLPVEHFRLVPNMSEWYVASDFGRSRSEYLIQLLGRVLKVMIEELAPNCPARYIFFAIVLYDTSSRFHVIGASSASRAISLSNAHPPVILHNR